VPRAHRPLETASAIDVWVRIVANVRGHAVRTFEIVDEGEIVVSIESGGEVFAIAAAGQVRVLAGAAPGLRKGLRRLRPLRNSPGARVEAASGRPGKPGCRIKRT